MKWLAMTAAALILLLGASLVSYYYLAGSAEQVCRELAGVEQALWAEDWQQAEAGLEQAEALWSKARRKWAMLIDHKDMDNIEISMVDLSGAIARRERDVALKEEGELVFFLRQIPDGERPTVENIL